VTKVRRKPPPLIYVDTCVYLDFLYKRKSLHQGTHEERWVSAKALFEAIVDGRAKLGTSSLIEVELGTAHDQISSDLWAESDATIRLLLQGPDTKYTEVDRFLAQDAKRLARELNQRILTSSGNTTAGQPKQLRALDAVHVAAAVGMNCDYLMTQDGHFPLGEVVEGVKVMRPDVVWEDVLF
jgi:hypothetical protein